MATAITSVHPMVRCQGAHRADVAGGPDAGYNCYIHCYNLEDSSQLTGESAAEEVILSQNQRHREAEDTMSLGRRPAGSAAVVTLATCYSRHG